MDGNGVRGTPLQAQVTEGAFILMQSDHPGQPVAVLEDAHRAHHDTSGARLSLSTARFIHVNGNEQAHPNLSTGQFVDSSNGPNSHGSATN
jgi:hypothetical protein